MKEDVLVINPHTLEVHVEIYMKCSACQKKLPERKFRRLRRNIRERKCKTCYEKYWMQKEDRRKTLPVESHLRAAVTRANRRSRTRQSIGPDITLDEAKMLWKRCKGACENCSTTLNFSFHPRRYNANRAVLDRITTSGNKSYANGNARFLCNVCNEEKGGWDLVHLLQDEIQRLRRKKRPRPDVMYTSILYPAVRKKYISSQQNGRPKATHLAIGTWCGGSKISSTSKGL